MRRTLEAFTCWFNTYDASEDGRARVLFAHF